MSQIRTSRPLDISKDLAQIVVYQDSFTVAYRGIDVTFTRRAFEQDGWALLLHVYGIHWYSRTVRPDGKEFMRVSNSYNNGMTMETLAEENYGAGFVRFFVTVGPEGFMPDLCPHYPEGTQMQMNTGDNS